LLVVAILAFIFLPAAPARADQPFRTSITMIASTGTYTVAGVNNSLFYTQNPKAFTFPRPATTNATTYTASYIVGTITNTIGTKTVTAGDSTLLATNTTWLMAGDKLWFTTSESGLLTNTVYYTGEEK
jgi:hypothetical protein